MTTPAEIRNIADLYRILEEQPQWNEALRSRMLSAELLAMPQQLVALRQTAEEHTRQFVELRQTAEENTRQIVALRQTAEEHTRQLADQTAAIKELRQTAEEHTRQLVELRQTAEEHTRQLVELRQTAEEHTRHLAEHTRQFVELRQTAEEHTRQLADQTAQLKELRQTAEENTRQLVELRRITENHTARMNRMEGDNSKIKGRMAEFKSGATSAVISSRLDLWNPQPLPTEQLLAIARDLGLNRSERDSFVDADLIFQGTDDDEQTFLCAVEISWTIQQHDIDRAQRNADLLRQALRHPAHAVVYGDRYELNLDWGKVHWVKMKD